jgi:hypothetical protein
MTKWHDATTHSRYPSCLITCLSHDEEEEDTEDDEDDDNDNDLD